MKSNVKNLVITAMMLALGFALPPLFHMAAAGAVMLPMHIPVLLAGLVCGPVYGGICGFLLPVLSSLFTGMPPLFPTAISMMLELCTYGVMTGLLLHKCAWGIYPAMVGSMLLGRCVAGIANAILFYAAGNVYTAKMFFTASFVTGLPGIAIQLVFVPAIVAVLAKANLIKLARVRHE